MSVLRVAHCPAAEARRHGIRAQDSCSRLLQDVVFLVTNALGHGWAPSKQDVDQRARPSMYFLPGLKTSSLRNM